MAETLAMEAEALKEFRCGGIVRLKGSVSVTSVMML